MFRFCKGASACVRCQAVQLYGVDYDAKEVVSIRGGAEVVGKAGVMHLKKTSHKAW